jgi:hypothetical protein
MRRRRLDVSRHCRGARTDGPHRDGRERRGPEHHHDADYDDDQHH